MGRKGYWRRAWSETGLFRESFTFTVTSIVAGLVSLVLARKAAMTQAQAVLIGIAVT